MTKISSKLALFKYSSSRARVSIEAAKIIPLRRHLSVFQFHLVVTQMFSS